MNEKELIEKFAELEHIQWCTWVRYMLKNMTAENLKKWEGQEKIPYNQLTEEEKGSDRYWAKRVLKTLKDAKKTKSSNRNMK